MTFNLITQEIAPNYGASISGTFATHNRISTIVTNRLSNLGIASGDEPSKEYGVWGEISTGTSRQDSRKGYNGYNMENYGITFGSDFEVSSNTDLGMAFNYSNTNIDGRNNATGDSIDIDTYSIIGYGSHNFPNRLTLEGQASVSHSDYDSIRDLTNQSAGYAYGEYDGKTYGLSARLNKDYTLNNVLNISPSLGLAYYHTNLDSYSETGSTGGLNVSNEQYDSLVSRLGAELTFEKYKPNEDWSMVSKVHGYWDHEFIVDDYSANVTYVGGSSAFSTEGLKPAPNSINLGGEIGFYNTKDVEISLNYDEDFKEDYIGHSGKLRIRKKF